MSDERDELFQLMLGRTTTKAVERILAAGYRKPRQVTTVEELDALPNGTILISSGRCPRYKWALWRVKTGGMIEQVGHELKGVTPFRYFVDPLPATVLHVGGTND